MCRSGRTGSQASCAREASLVATLPPSGAAWACKQQPQFTTSSKICLLPTVRCNSGGKNESGGSPEAERDDTIPKAPRRQQQAVEMISITLEGLLEQQDHTHVRRGIGAFRAARWLASCPETRVLP